MYLKICSDLIYKVNDKSLVYLVELFAKKENDKVVFFTKLFVNNGKTTDEAEFSQILDVDVKELVKERQNSLKEMRFTRYEENFLSIALDYKFLYKSKIFVRDIEEILCTKADYCVGRQILRIDKTAEKLLLNRDFIFSKALFENAIKEYLEYVTGGIYVADMFKFENNMLFFNGTSELYVTELDHIIWFVNEHKIVEDSNYCMFPVDRHYYETGGNLALAIAGITPIHYDYTIDTKVATRVAICIKKNGSKDRNFKRTKRKLLRKIPKYRIDVMFENEQYEMYVVRGFFLKK